MVDNRVWKSYVWYKGDCFFVSTIERDFSTFEGVVQGQETLVWEYDWNKNERGKWIYQAEGVLDHQAICRCLINTGKIPDTDSDDFQRFR